MNLLFETCIVKRASMATRTSWLARLQTGHLETNFEVFWAARLKLIYRYIILWYIYIDRYSLLACKCIKIITPTYSHKGMRSHPQQKYPSFRYKTAPSFLPCRPAGNSSFWGSPTRNFGAELPNSELGDLSQPEGLGRSEQRDGTGQLPWFPGLNPGANLTLTIWYYNGCWIMDVCGYSWGYQWMLSAPWGSAQPSWEIQRDGNTSPMSYTKKGPAGKCKTLQFVRQELEFGNFGKRHVGHRPSHTWFLLYNNFLFMGGIWSWGIWRTWPKGRFTVYNLPINPKSPPPNAMRVIRASGSSRGPPVPPSTPGRMDPVPPGACVLRVSTIAMVIDGAIPVTLYLQLWKERIQSKQQHFWQSRIGSQKWMFPIPSYQHVSTKIAIN